MTSPSPAKLTPDQRAAQRSLVGLVRVGSAVVDSVDGLCIWRAAGAEEWQVGPEEITAHLETLRIPYQVVVKVKPRTAKRPAQGGFEVQVPWESLPAVTRWVPSVQRLIDALAGSMDPRAAGLW